MARPLRRVLSVFLLALAGCSRELSRYGTVPDFKLPAATALGASRASRADLIGAPWIADFVFTTCQGPCPALSANMARLQRQLPAPVRFVSFSVDPAHDTPAVLVQYARRFGADPKRWLFVTGGTEEVYRLLREGFKLAVEPDPRAPAGFLVTHSTKFVLIDAQGVVRGYYDGLDSEELGRLATDASGLCAPR